MVTEVNTGRTRLAESCNHQALLPVTRRGFASLLQGTVPVLL